MIMDITRNFIRIIPQTEQDKAYIEDTLGLRKEGDSIRLVRRAPHGLPSAIAYLETEKEVNKEVK